MGSPRGGEEAATELIVVSTEEGTSVKRAVKRGRRFVSICHLKCTSESFEKMKKE